MMEYVVTTTCVVEADNTIEAAREADIWVRNNSVFIVDDGSHMSEVDLTNFEDD